MLRDAGRIQEVAGTTRRGILSPRGNRSPRRPPTGRPTGRARRWGRFRPPAATPVAKGPRPMVALSVQIEIAGGLSWARWRRLVREVDRLGYRGLYLCDHFLPGGSGYADSV